MIEQENYSIWRFGRIILDKFEALFLALFQSFLSRLSAIAHHENVAKVEDREHDEEEKGGQYDQNSWQSRDQFTVAGKYQEVIILYFFFFIWDLDYYPPNAEALNADN